ncbi:MAG TPA: response regulator [Actinomycetes bacterium]|nr:response regulator [Actinomycetes bacterium]
MDAASHAGAPRADADAGTGSGPGAAVPRVLLVDDCAEVRQGLRELLEDEGIEIVGEAADGAAGVSRATELAPDVVLMDLRMPVMDGIAATRQIKQALPLTQVLILTAYDEWEHSARVAGAYAYLVKGTGPALVRDVVLQAWQLKVGLERRADGTGA